MRRIHLILPLLLSLISLTAQAQDRDARIKAFLETHRNSWKDLNVPYEDGEALYNLILEKKYTRALEIGTSTGHSTIWIAWALSKTGGKLITLEIDEGRHKQALTYLRELDLLPFVDAQRCDAHERVKTLTGPFDFVFSDADKSWYKQYFIDIEPKLTVGSCFTAHNVRNPYGGIKDFLDHVRGLPAYKTHIAGSSRAGISFSFKTK